MADDHDDDTSRINDHMLAFGLKLYTAKEYGKPEKDVTIAESKHTDARELRLRALDAVAWWLDCSRHERDEASGVWMARYIRATDWRPISTMPTDGTRVLVTNGREVEIRSQRTGAHAGPSRDGQPTSGHGISWDHWPRPTHWRPLPVPPRNDAV